MNKPGAQRFGNVAVGWQRCLRSGSGIGREVLFPAMIPVKQQRETVPPYAGQNDQQWFHERIKAGCS